MNQRTDHRYISIKYSLSTLADNIFHGAILGLLALVLWMLPLSSVQAAEGTISMDLTYAAAGLGYETGTATVTLGGKTATYNIKGFQFLGAGVSNFKGTGAVNGAHSLNDLNGDFTVTRGSLSAIVGGVTMSLHNPRGVAINLSGTSTGIDASVGPGKLTFSRTGAIKPISGGMAEGMGGMASPQHHAASGARIGGGGSPLPHIGLYAYTRSHARVSNPPDLLGGPLRVNLVKKNTSTRWVLPGPRFLDPAVFGSPAHPVGFEQAPFPLIGIPPKLRQSMNGKYTIVDHATPFSDWMVVGVGSVSMKLVDATAIDGARTKDKVDFVATFESPDKMHGYKVVVKKALPHGFGYPFFGGVVTNHLLHGGTAIGTRLMPTEFTYAGFWGVGDIYVDGRLTNPKQIVHVMLGEFVRGDNQHLQFDGGVDPHGMTLHLMVPPYKATPKGPVMAPLRSGYIPFPEIKKRMMKMKEMVMKMPPEKQKMMMPKLKATKALMMKTKKHVQAMMAEGKMFGQPFFHVMFGMRGSDLRISH